MAAQFFVLALAFAACTAAPQFSSEEIAQPPTPYDFGYGVNVGDTGDAKEHKETVSPSGRTEGEYRWQLPNGLFMVVRYFVEGDSGFQAEVSEEPGPEVANYYSNSLTQENSQGGVPAASQNLGKSLVDLRSSVNAISAPRPATRPALRPTQTFRSQPQPQPQPQPTFISQPTFSSNIIDGGIIDGGIIDGGIIDGGIIDGGIINDSFEDSRFSG
ncbi:uncharacterized protein LOC123512230 [Portunus trituberculatus]|uniref:uncharacterized protein LOC123512230 n=1 Tax=Portunus trituberculatus TaxID=210409 RepID=UPI001E1CB76F|nr:uncharacterized protein LOC123512230 [Portunus trituberculatus]